ncbi:MAG: TetR/AcrR family transcriptional regulator [Ilumatobacteraceae bacterium]
MTRTRQRERTRQQILDAISRLVDSGEVDPSVDQIAAEAGVSRATFYRYFGSPAEGLFQVFTDRSLPSIDEALAGATAVDDRIGLAADSVNGYLLADPNATRAFERAMLDRSLSGTSTPDDRPARRLDFIDAALEPIADQLSADDLFLVRHALALTMGSSVVPALMDTCGLDRQDAARVARFAATALARDAWQRSQAMP